MLGLVRRDLLFDIADAVAREERAAAFELAGQAVESGYDLRLVVRELARLRATCSSSGRPVARRRSRDRRRGRARAPRGARDAVLARGPDARLRRADQGRVRHPRLARSRAITSRWRCCGGFTCASWCRSRI